MPQKRHHGLTCPAAGSGSYAQGRGTSSGAEPQQGGRGNGRVQGVRGAGHSQGNNRSCGSHGRTGKSPSTGGVLQNRRRALQKLVRGLQGAHGEVLSFAYEAGPCGYGVYREITGTGHDCQVVAPVSSRAGPPIASRRIAETR